MLIPYLTALYVEYDKITAKTKQKVARKYWNLCINSNYKDLQYQLGAPAKW